MTENLARLCASHGIEPHYTGFDGVERAVPGSTLAALAEHFGLETLGSPPPGIDDARAETAPPRCQLPLPVAQARVWGITCQLPALSSQRNLGIGDFADLAHLCELAGREGADFVGTSPIHALYWSMPERVSPFFPSNRYARNPLLLAPDWIAGFSGLSDDEAAEAARLRAGSLIEPVGVAHLKRRVLRRAFEAFPWTDSARADFVAFQEAAPAALLDHALFEALAEALANEGYGAEWPNWPAPWRDRNSAAVQGFAQQHRKAVEFHLWLQWQAERQLARVSQTARTAGMRLGLYLDLAVGSAPDGSAAWSDPDLTIPGVSIGAPPDAFSLGGQDWGLAPVSPLRLAANGGRAYHEMLAAAVGHAGALRIDHAMGLARLWLIPRGASPQAGAYMRYPLEDLLRSLADVSSETGAAMIGEDLGVVPEGFRALMGQRGLHGYELFLFHREEEGFAPPGRWRKDALASFGTHDMPPFAGWWRGHDVDVRRALGMLDASAWRAEHHQRSADRAAVERVLDCRGDEAELSPLLYAHIAQSPSRLVGLQLEDALGMMEQVNIPGTIDEHPNWRRRLAETLEAMPTSPGFQAHTAALRRVRPR